MREEYDFSKARKNPYIKGLDDVEVQETKDFNRVEKCAKLNRPFPLGDIVIKKEN